MRLVPNFVLKGLCLLLDNVTMCLGIVQCTEVGFTRFPSGRLHSLFCFVLEWPLSSSRNIISQQATSCFSLAKKMQPIE